MTYSPLRFLETRQEIGGEAKTVVFDAPGWVWAAGQHLPIRLMINGQEVRRSYSISAAPGSTLRITVKRVQGGLVSNHINDHLQPGDVIEAAAPAGRFTLQPGPLKRRTHYFFGAGSGITPLYAMLSDVVAREPQSAIHLAYGNASEKTILLQDEINARREQAAERMSVHHILSAPGWWSGAEYWRKGRIDEAAIEALFAENPPYAQDAQYYICGPGGMNTALRSALMALDVPANRIHMESYGGEVMDTSVAGVAAQAEITLKGTSHTLPVAAGQTLLDAIRAAGISPPFSCGSGICGTCRAQIIDGQVHMRTRAALENSDIAQGTILTCQSLPQTNKIKIIYNEA